MKRELASWIHYVEQDIARRDDRQRFLWAIFAGALAAAAVLAHWNWGASSPIAAFVLGIAGYSVVARALVISVQESLRPPVLRGTATIDAVVGKRYVEIFGMPAPLLFAIGFDAASLALAGVASAVVFGDGLTWEQVLATVAGVWLLSSAFLNSVSLLIPRRLMAGIMGRNAAVGHRILRGTTGRETDLVPGIKELRTGARDWFGSGWKESQDFAKASQQTQKLRRIDIAAFATLAWLFLSSLEGTLVLATLLTGGAIALFAFAVRLGILLHAEFARAYLEQLLFMINLEDIPTSQVPFVIALVHALSELNARPIVRLDIMWTLVRMDEFAPGKAPQKKKT